MEVRSIDFDNLMDSLTGDPNYEDNSQEVKRPNRDPDFIIELDNFGEIMKAEYWIPEEIRQIPDGCFTFDLSILEESARSHTKMFKSTDGPGPEGDHAFIKALDNYRIDQTLLGN